MDSPWTITTTNQLNTDAPRNGSILLLMKGSQKNPLQTAALAAGIAVTVLGAAPHTQPVVGGNRPANVTSSSIFYKVNELTGAFATCLENSLAHAAQVEWEWDPIEADTAHVVNSAFFTSYLNKITPALRKQQEINYNTDSDPVLVI